MSMLLNEEQQALAESAHDFLSEQANVTHARTLRDSGSTDGFSKDAWQQVVELGWTGAAFSEEAGGYGLGYKGLGAVFEHIGRNLSAFPLLSSVVLGGSAIELGGTDAQKEAYLADIISGERLVALAVDEAARHNPTQITTTATKDGGHYRISGEKTFVLDANTADVFIVAARTSGESTGGFKDAQGISLFIVDDKAKGVTIKNRKMLDSRNAAEITFDNAAGVLLGEADSEGKGFQTLDAVLDRARACIAAELYGICMDAFERTVEYLKEREQFGVKIGTFQALQHRASRLYVDLQLAQSSVLNALAAIDKGSRGAPLAVSLAKQQLSDLSLKLLNEATQLHGGIGVTDEYDLGLYLKRARVLQQLFGDGMFHRSRYAMMRGF